MQIVSNEGFYQLNAARETSNCFSAEFPGTIVTMNFNTNDPSFYGMIDGNISEDLF